MSEIKQAIQKLANRHEEIYSKIGRVISNNAKTATTQATVDVELYDSKSIVKGVRLTAAGGNDSVNVTIPKDNSDVIITFLSRNDAYVSVIADSTYTQIESKNTDGDTSGITVGSESGDKVVSIKGDEIHMNTKNGGSVSVTTIGGEDVFVIHNNKVIKFIVDDDSQIIINDEGIDITVPTDPLKKIEIGNDTDTLKTLLDSLIDSMINAQFLSPVGTAAYSSVTTIPELNALKVRISNLFI